MKQLSILAAAMLFTVASVLAQSTPIEFKETKYSFGKIKQNVPVTHVFEFKNVSGKPVVIQDAVAGCGCTTPVYSKSAIAKGASDKVSVTFNAAAVGPFQKDVTVTLAGVSTPVVLKIDGEVVSNEAKAPEAKSNH